MKKIIFLINLICFSVTILYSQSKEEVGEKYVYEFRDGTTIIGTFQKEEQGNV